MADSEPPMSANSWPICSLPVARPHLGNMTCASSAKRSRMLPPVDVAPALSSALRYSRATDLRCSSVMICVATAMVGAPLLLQSAFAVDAGHEGGEVVGGEKGRRWGRTPVEQALGALKCLRGPQLVVDDAVQVGVVLTEVAGRVLEVPEEVRPGVVPAQPPDVPFGMVLEHRSGAAADLVDVVDFPGGVVQEADRCLEDQDVVMVRRAAHERADILYRVAELEAEAVEEERTGDGQVCGAQHGVAELAGLDPLGAQHTWCTGTAPLDPAGAVVGGGAHRCLGDPGGDLDGGPHAGRLLDRRDGARSAA